MRATLVVLAAAASAAGAVAGASAGGTPPHVALTVVFDPGDARATSRAALRCAGDESRGRGGLRTVAVHACRVARARRSLLHGRRASGPCAEIFGGPQAARVSGEVGGDRVARRFDRTDGCRIAEWDVLFPLLPRTRGAAGP